jgi:hypothetical protein
MVTDDGHGHDRADGDTRGASTGPGGRQDAGDASRVRDPGETPKRGAAVVGTILIVVGLGLTVLQLTDAELEEPFVLVTIGAAFLAAYVWTRLYGLLIPGMLMAGLGGAQAVDLLAPLAPEAGLLGLGAGFVLIYLADAVIARRTDRWWPLIPGGILLALALLEAMRGLRDAVTMYWPLLVVAAGAVILLKGLLGDRGRQSK